MGERPMRVYGPAAGIDLPPLAPGLRRRRPRAWAEWKALRRWGRLPEWEESPVGYLLREAREGAGLTQARLAARLDCSQQAVAQAERADANPTVGLVRRWAAATGTRLSLILSRDG